MDLKQLNIQEKSFKANGKTYFIEAGDISIERWAKYEEFTLELQYGVSQTGMFQNWKKVTQLANELKFSDIAILANNMQNGIIGVFDRQIIALKLCALFINEQNENRGIISDDIINNKIEDWSKEGFGIGAFFQLALGFSRLTNQISDTLSLESLESIKKMSQEKVQG